MDLVGVSEIADMLGVTRGRASQLASAPGFPKPLGEPKAGRIWRRQTVERWAEKHRQPGGGMVPYAPARYHDPR